MVKHMGNHYVGPRGLGAYEDLRPAGYKQRCSVHGPPYRQVFVSIPHDHIIFQGSIIRIIIGYNFLITDMVLPN